MYPVEAPADAAVTVTLHGANLGDDAQVFFCGEAANVLSQTPSVIVIAVTGGNVSLTCDVLTASASYGNATWPTFVFMAGTPCLCLGV
jgi:hypothetical protein